MTRILVCLLLIPLAGTPPHAAPRAGTKALDSDPQILARRARFAAAMHSFRKAFDSGDITAAAAIAQKGHQSALRTGDRRVAALFLMDVGSCRFRQYRHQEALDAYLAARDLAGATANLSLAGVLDVNISSLYSQLGQTEMAALTAERALRLLAGAERKRYLPTLLIHLGNLRAEQGRTPEALTLLQKGLAAADRAGDAGLCALGWDRVGLLYERRGDFHQAERAMLEAYRLRRLSRAPGLDISYRDLGKLRLEQGDLRLAAALMEQAVARLGPGSLLPGWSVYYYRGRVRLAQGRMAEAMDDLRTAVRLVRVWRRTAPAGDATRVGIENWKDVAGLYQALVETGNRMYFSGGRRALAEETFAAAEENRAASLRALVAEPGDLRRLPAEYGETVRKLEAIEIQLVRREDAGARARMRQLQAALIQWESRAGSSFPVEIPDLVGQVRRHLGADEALLSFHLASPHSYLWAVTRGDFELYRLPAAAEIAKLAQRFEKCVRGDGQEGTLPGRDLYRQLFGQLSSTFQAKPRWLLALDSPLFEVPFAALPAGEKADAAVYLIARHAIETMPGAGILASETRQEQALDGGFLGIADAVYNGADPRWGKGAADDLHLARLAGSAHEIEACARVWGGRESPQLLEGMAASRDQIVAALAAHPAVVHFATHVVHSAQQPRSGLLVLSLTGSGQNEVLGAAEITTWHLNGALVALSGCASGTADALPGTGLMGLTRAWLAAGSQAVVASRWSTPDDASAFFPKFYGYLRRAPEAGAAGALQRAQLDMIRAKDWRSQPRYWGAYFVAGR